MWDIGGMAIMDLKWVGWIPPVAIPNPDQPTLANFLTHHYIRTEMESLKSPKILIQRFFQKLCPEPFLRGEGTISKMCLQLNILDSILTVGLQHLSGAQFD